MHSISPPGVALAVRGLTRTYGSGDQTVAALRGIDLTLSSGTFTVVMGPSGSGKSTLLNCISGLEHPTSGSVTIAGEDISGWSESQLTVLRRQRLGFVFQGFHLIPYLTAEQNIGLPIRLAGRRPKRDHIHSLLASVDLLDRGGRLPSELSGGQQQRVAIARAMATSPAVLLADEPTGAVDSANARSVLGLLRNTVDTLGQTILMVTHDPVAAAYADSAVFLVDGHVAGRMHGPTADAVAAQIANLDELITGQLVEVST
ncbi:MAG: ATP-binding cassette domain-containing protein [Acidimicrobiia bacterium]|nr:ATP-binding cassette domain-containing protein [Acidimicrobiia bacterium]